MPDFFTFFWTPWRILSYFWVPSPAAAATSAVAPGTAGAGSWSLCGVRDLGAGQIESVCSILGYQMPRFILTASFFIFLLFLLSSLLMVAQTTLLAQSLTRLLDKTDRLARDEAKGLSSKGFATLKDLMERERPTQRVWRRFERSLIESDEDTLLSTQPIEQGFSKKALLEENVAHQFFAAVPGLLTGLGLLMTFVAILDGLSHVSVSSSMDVQGIGGLINGLSGKFISSIVALSCTVLFVFVERLAYSRPTKPYIELTERLSRLIKYKTAEHLLYELLHSRKGGRS